MRLIYSWIMFLAVLFVCIIWSNNFFCIFLVKPMYSGLYNLIQSLNFDLEILCLLAKFCCVSNGFSAHFSINCIISLYGLVKFLSLLAILISRLLLIFFNAFDILFLVICVFGLCIRDWSLLWESILTNIPPSSFLLPNHLIKNSSLFSASSLVSVSHNILIR